MEFGKDVLKFVWNEDQPSDNFYVAGFSLEMIGAATEKGRLPG